jgi:hypothetical protein
MVPIPEYWQAVARAINAEDAKASIFIQHNQSRGAAREAILKEVLIRQTPDPYRVTSGFVFHPESACWCSKQCDVLVYDPRVARPYYAIGGLAVVPRYAANLVIEVKTTLDQASFDDILGVWEDVFWLPVPTLGFAFDGVKFDTFRGYVQTSVKEAPRGLPDCLAVHNQNYLYVRTGYHGVESTTLPYRRRTTKCQFLVDFAAAKTGEGTASALFLHIYNLLISSPLSLPSTLLDECRKLGVRNEHIHIINDEATQA